MTAEELSKRANEIIVTWAQGKDKLVVAIDGYTGIGKTTLLHNLARLNSDIVPVNRDDFLFSRKVTQEKLVKADNQSKVFELEVCDDKKLEDFITAFRNGAGLYGVNTYNAVSGEIDIAKSYDCSKKIMVVEGVFMFHPKSLLNKLWDKRIYLQGDIDKIDERRIKREKEKWGKDYFPEDHPDSYFRHVTIALKRYAELYKPEEVADAVLRTD
ncbi:MAG: hypothetical protein A3A33_02920 [Candidatus Yanofskybacteria bacterium RIFCSPLOWO2_01_FULL_49_25]|uniref:Phosphoribulokinase/uridine kinase domain-containing protein n=1 Tax=Candidatus Yanofskybacteria bacterium RIFCSPLOWO2_01_FULL_49_25 TaxID=1802701 RepID=A0A1F8GUT9_9BACT|nr:MAG: hypothetical protein A3A33_02920 [Candidatus Yanofskybacteria bacterium RIFCSPLOWO2_01_FULL_49_25]